MARAQNQVSIVFKAIDELTGTVGRIERRLKNLDDTFGTLGGRIKAGIQWHLVYRGINQITRAVDELVNAVPNLIKRGQEWADTVDRIADVTGMTAEQSSELAAVAKMVGVNVEGMGRNLSFLAKSAVYNRDAFKEWGVQTRDQNGRLLSSYQIFQNVRRRVSDVGAGFLSTARAQKVLGRGTLDLMDVLLLSNSQYGLLAAQARKSGLILNQAALDAAEAWNRTRSQLDLSITGIGAQVMNKVAPVLIRLVNGISEAINANMDRIATFVAQVAAFVAGVLGGFLGIDFNMKGLMETVQTGGNAAEKAGPKYQKLGGGMKDASSGADALTKALQKQIDAIDRQLARLDKQERKADARRQQRELLADIAAARAELADVRSASIFAAGMTEAEEELARQAQAQAIIDAEKKVAEAKKKLRQFQQDQDRQAARDALQARRDALQQQLSAHTQALSKMTGANATATRQMNAQWQKLFGGGGKNGPTQKIAALSKEMSKAVKDALAFGKAFSQDIITFLFGPKSNAGTNTSSIFGGAGPKHEGTRQGGLIKGLQDLQKTIGDIGGPLKLVGDNLGALMLAIIAWKTGLAGWISKGILDGLRPGGGGGGGGGSPTPETTPAGDKGKSGGARPSRGSRIGRGIRDLPGRSTEALKNVGLSAFGAMPDIPNLDVDRSDPLARLLGSNIYGWLFPQNVKPPGTKGTMGAVFDGMRNKPQPADVQYPEMKNAWYWQQRMGFTGGANLGGGMGNPGGGVGGFGSGGWAGAGGHWMGLGVNPLSGIGSGIGLDPLTIFRRYLGPASPLVSGQQDQTDATDSAAAWALLTAGNTSPMADGTVGVQNQKFEDIGSIKDVKGQVPVDASGKRVTVDASGKTVTVWTPGGRKLPTEGGGKGGGTVPDWSNIRRDIHASAGFDRRISGDMAAVRSYQRLSVAWLTAIAQHKTNIFGTMPAAQGNGQRGGAQRMTIQLDKQETRRLLRGEEVNTSLRPVPGT